MRVKLTIDPLLNRDKIHEACEEPVVIRVNNFTEDGLRDFEKELNLAGNSGQPVIPIIVDSFGGSIHSVLGMVAAIENCELPVATICTTKCMSAGAVLFSFGDEGYRYMHPDATMMIHDAAWGTGGKVEDMKVDTKYVDEMNQRMFKKMAKHLGKDHDFILGMIKTKNHLDWFLSAKEAKKIGIVNHLSIPKFEVTVSLDIKFG